MNALAIELKGNTVTTEIIPADEALKLMDEIMSTPYATTYDDGVVTMDDLLEAEHQDILAMCAA